MNPLRPAIDVGRVFPSFPSLSIEVDVAWPVRLHRRGTEMTVTRSRIRHRLTLWLFKVWCRSCWVPAMAPLTRLRVPHSG